MRARPRLDHLGVVGLHRRRHDDDVGGADVGGGVARLHATRPSVASRSVVVGPLLVRARHRVAEVRQQFGDAAHADAADADEVHVPCPSEHARHLPPRELRRRDRRHGPPRPAGRAPRAAAAIRCAPRPASAASASDASSASRSPVRSRSSITSAAPAAGQRRGVLALVVVGGGRQRHEHRRPAEDGQLGQRRRAGPRTRRRRRRASARACRGRTARRWPGRPAAA